MNEYYCDLIDEPYIAHYGAKGMKWGIRKFQNKDGSYTPLGLARYFGSNRKSSGQTLGQKLSRGTKNFNNIMKNRSAILERNKRLKKSKSSSNSSESGSSKKKGLSKKQKMAIAGVVAGAAAAGLAAYDLSRGNKSYIRKGISAISSATKRKRYTELTSGSQVKTSKKGADAIKNILNGAKSKASSIKSGAANRFNANVAKGEQVVNNARNSAAASRLGYYKNKGQSVVNNARMGIAGARVRGAATRAAVSNRVGAAASKFGRTEAGLSIKGAGNIAGQTAARAGRYIKAAPGAARVAANDIGANTIGRAVNAASKMSPAQTRAAAAGLGTLAAASGTLGVAATKRNRKKKK